MTTLPAHLANRSNRRSVASAVVANIPSGSPPHVSIKGNRFTLVDAGGDSEPVTTADPKTGIPYLDCVIVDALERPSRIYYKDPYDATATSYGPPDCWSDNGVAPSRTASNPQHVTCGGCPQAVWGSATSRNSGKGIPACAQNQKLALVVPGDDVVFLLRVPPNSLAGLATYLNKFRGQPFAEGDVITRISFKPDVLGTLTFRATGHIDQEIMAFCDKVLAAKATDELVGRLDLPREGAMALPSAPAAAQITQTHTNTAPTANLTPAPAADTAEPAPAGRRGRRPKTNAPAGGPLDKAPFRPEPSPVAGAAAGNGTAQFGIAPGVEPNADLQAAIDDVFGPA